MSENFHEIRFRLSKIEFDMVLNFYHFLFILIASNKYISYYTWCSNSLVFLTKGQRFKLDWGRLSLFIFWKRVKFLTFWYQFFTIGPFFIEIWAKMAAFFQLLTPLHSLVMDQTPIIPVKILSFKCIFTECWGLLQFIIAKNHPSLHTENFECSAFQSFANNCVQWTFAVCFKKV